MKFQLGSLLRVITDYDAPYPYPISAKAGEMVTVDLAKRSDIPGWLWCTARDGKSGWVPESYLERKGGSVRLRVDYDAIELTIRTGSILTAHKLECGFYWVTDRNGHQGWVPANHVEPVSTGRAEAK